MQAHCNVRLRVKRILKHIYILLFSCSVTKAVHPVLMLNLTTTEFIKSFKKSRRGKPNIIYSDNAKNP